MKLALSSTSLRSSTPRAVVEAARRLGYEAVEIWTEHLWDAGEDPAALGRLAAERRLAVSLHGPSRDLNVTSSNPGIRRESRAQYAKALEEAARIGARIVNLHPGSLSSSHDRAEDHRRLMAEYGAELAGEAARLGVGVALEIMERRRGEYVTDLPAAAGLVRAVNHPAFGLTLDVAHLLSGGQAVETEGFEPLILHVHLSGSTRERVHVPLAEGIYDLRPALARLRRFYSGIVAIEGYARGREMEAAGENKRTFDRLLQDAAPEEG